MLLKIELKTLLEKGTPIEDLAPAAEEKARKYFNLKKWGNKITATANNKEIKEAMLLRILQRGNP